jgi:hypothetical protein
MHHRTHTTLHTTRRRSCTLRQKKRGCSRLIVWGGDGDAALGGPGGWSRRRPGFASGGVPSFRLTSSGHRCQAHYLAIPSPASFESCYLREQTRCWTPKTKHNARPLPPPTPRPSRQCSTHAHASLARPTVSALVPSFASARLGALPARGGTTGTPRARAGARHEGPEQRQEVL